ncbi:MAG TPA: tripartite tricarboxylate transporter TctB family protein [Desulfobacterales bacterium]|jgi:Tripartite tricarboxylate transporter TctB family|nr:tripartite tricarboxylate transporter TctB family protein [Desulfobacterales bacterium]
MNREPQRKYPFRRQDIYAGLILIVLALFVIVESWRMPREFLGFPAYAGPGIVTGLLGIGLLGMAVTLLVRACRRPGAGVAISRADIRSYLANSQTRRFGLVLLLCVAYLLALGRGIPYSITTGAYLLVTMAVFRAASWWMIALVSGLAATGLAVVFNKIFLVPLP